TGLLHSSLGHHDTHSLPTRRSSDLTGTESGAGRMMSGGSKAGGADSGSAALAGASRPKTPIRIFPRSRERRPLELRGKAMPGIRSEEHTSELQSRENLVCRLLLEKK